MIKIEKLDHLGRGIGKINNKIIFVPNSLPNELIEIKITKEKKSFCEGIVTKYIKTSDERIKPICPYFGKCGGCDLMQMSYNNQLKYKQEKIENIMSKFDTKINNIIECDTIYNYRNKITFQVNNNLGLFTKGSNEVIKVDNCYLVNKEINKMITSLQQLNLKNLNKIICKYTNNQMMIIIDSNEELKIPDILKRNNINIYQKTKKGYNIIQYNKPLIAIVGNKKYQISPDSFFQVNPNTTEKLYSKIKDYCTNLNSKCILDLYCGTGTIGIYVSDIADEIIGIEINKDAIEDAKNNMKLNDIKNIKFICNDVEQELKKINTKPDTIIVDPPRSGLSKKTIKTLLNFKSTNLIYISCDPLTLKRDLELLNNYYNIIEITPFDMFPHTHHVECVALLVYK